MSFGVRRSIYKNVYGSATQGAHYSNLKITNDFGDSTGIKSNAKYLSVIWQTSGGGAFTVLPHGQEQRMPDSNIRFFSGHTGPVMDTEWNPFDDDLVVSASADSTVNVWRVPDDFAPVSETDDVQPVKSIATLKGHQKPVRLVGFNPSAGNVLASASTDSSIIVWDIEKGERIFTVRMDKPATSISWDATGKYIVSVPQYGQPTIWDPRLGKSVVDFPANSTAKARRVIWLGEQEKIVTTGKSFGDGQIALWDVKNPRTPLSTDQWGAASSILTPFWDEGTQMLYVNIKGERTIKYYELHNNELEELFYYQGTDFHSGVTFMPKRGVNVRAKELTRAFRIIGGNTIEPVPFTIPRTQDAFIPEAYPPTVGLTPYTSAKEWAADPTVAGIPPKFSLEGLWSGEGLTTISEGGNASTVDIKDTTAPAPAAPEQAPKLSTERKTTPPASKISTPVQARADPKASMASAASKFADADGDSEKEESAFDEPKPAAGAATPPGPTGVSKTEIERLLRLGEKCKSEISVAQRSLASLATELKNLVNSAEVDGELKERVNKLSI